MSKPNDSTKVVNLLNTIQNSPKVIRTNVAHLDKTLGQMESEVHLTEAFIAQDVEILVMAHYERMRNKPGLTVVGDKVALYLLATPTQLYAYDSLQSMFSVFSLAYGLLGKEITEITFKDDPKLLAKVDMAIQNLIFVSYIYIRKLRQAAGFNYVPKDVSLNPSECVGKERERQNNKFGVQFHSFTEWYAILGEEFGEVAEEHMQCIDMLLVNIPSEVIARYDKEIVETMAVCYAMLADFRVRYGYQYA